MANAFAISRVTNVLSITGLKGQDLTLGPGTFGTALTFTSATGAATFAATITGSVAAVLTGSSANNRFVVANDTTGATRALQVTNTARSSEYFGIASSSTASKITSLGGFSIGTGGSGTTALSIDTSQVSTFSGSILGSGGSAPTSTTTGSNVFTAGIATSGPIFSGTLNTTGTNSDIVYGARFINTNAQSNAATGIELRGSNKSAYIVNITDGRTYFYTNAVAGQTAYPTETAWLFVAATGAPTFTGNLTVSGTGTSSFAGSVQVSTAANVAQLILRSVATDVTNKSVDIVGTPYTSANSAYGLVHGFSNSTDNYATLGGGSGVFNAATRTQLYAAANNNTLAGTLVAEFTTTKADFTGITTSGTSLTTAAVLAKSLALSENLITGGGLGLGVTSTATAGSTTVLSATSKAVQVFTGSAAQSVTLPAAAVYGAGAACVYVIKNRSTGSITINRSGSDLIDGATSYVLLAGANDSVTLISDGVSAWEIT